VVAVIEDGRAARWAPTLDVTEILREPFVPAALLNAVRQLPAARPGGLTPDRPRGPGNPGRG